MWYQLVLCCLVGLASATDFGWKTNTEYVYKINGRTLTGLHEVQNQYSGILVNGNLIVRGQPKGKLSAKIVDAKFAQVHANLAHGWDTEIPHNQLSYQPLPLSDRTFEIVVAKGIVQDVIVERDVDNWEANFIKAVVSNLQLDTMGERAVEDHQNQVPSENSNNAVFNNIEDCVSGRYETTYEISPLPEYILHHQPWLSPRPELKGNGEIIEIVKNRNFSRHQNLGYHYGLGNNVEWEPYSNEMGNFFTRSSMSRVIVSGTLNRYTIQSSNTVNQFILRPTLNNLQRGMVVSSLNLTLDTVEDSHQDWTDVQQPLRLRSLVYSPYNANNEVKHIEDNASSSEENRNDRGEIDEHFTKLYEAPQTPLLPSLLGKMSAKQTSNVIEIAEKIAREIGRELQDPEHMMIPQSTLSKFNLLTKIVRLMNVKETKETIGKLYSSDSQGAKLDSWYAMRDAIAESGTGPALLAIQDMIKNKQIEREEAAQIIATTAKSVRQPTSEYMRAFYALVTREDVKSQAILNDTAILSFSSLVRKVYVDPRFSDNQYPTQAFGNFRKSPKGQLLLTEEYIPYLAQQLKRAVQDADSHKVLVYIRALGNVGHKNILPVFKPYLEGTKQISQFQRLHMVMSMNKLAQIHPESARSVLYKIYQNQGDVEEIRAAAVFQLMRTEPSAQMLQRMAQYTNLDVAEQVNAAVKSAITSAAQLKGEQFAILAKNARSAQPLLIKKTYGAHYSRNQLRNFVTKAMNSLYVENYYTLGSQDSFIPKGIKYYLRSELGGVRHELVNLKAVVSSIDELTNVLEQQTEMHQQKQQQQTQNAHEAQQNKFSSESILRLLNVQSEEREQLEGKLLLQLGGSATRFFTLNNQTIEFLPEVIREIEESLREGQNIHYTKLMNRYDMTLSFPTAMSFPFVYTLDAPTLVHVDGKLEANSEPKISSNNKLHKPHTVQAKSEIRTVISTKIQAELGFVTPFDQQHYVSGIDRDVQINVPVKSNIEIDLKNKQFKAEFEPIEPKEDTELIHYSLLPFTAQRNILKVDSVTDKQEIEDESAHRNFDLVLGKETGMAFRVKYNGRKIKTPTVNDYLRCKHISCQLLTPLLDETIHGTKLQIWYSGKLSTTHKVTLRMGCENRYDVNEEDNRNEDLQVNQFSQLPQDFKSRQQEIAKMASAGIHNANVHVHDASIEFEGEKRKTEYAVTVAYAHGHVDEKNRALLYVKKQDSDGKRYEIVALAKARVPKSAELDFIEALKFDPTSNIDIDVAFGENLENPAEIHLQATFDKTEARRKYLQSQPLAKQCRREMQEGNKQMSACARMMIEANLMDHINIKLHHEGSPLLNAYSQQLDILLGMVQMVQNKEHRMEVDVQFEPKFEFAHVTLKKDKLHYELPEVRVHQLYNHLDAMQPRYSTHDGLAENIISADIFQPICILDKTAANTFDNKTYDLNLNEEWTVVMHYTPQFARNHRNQQSYQKQQEEEQHEQYVILARRLSSAPNQMEVKFTIRTPESQGHLVTVDLKTIQEVFVNQKQYKLNDKQSTDIEDGLIQMYILPNGEIKVHVRHAFNIVYDGQRMKLEVTTDKFCSAVRGLCGTLTGNSFDDFLTPKNCIVRSAKSFIDTYTVYGQARELHSEECYFQYPRYVNVINDRKNERTTKKNVDNQMKNSDRCTNYQTRYFEENEQMCFTIEPMPICAVSCTSESNVRKSVAVHCVQKSNISKLWKNQIEKGASPDFSHKTVTKHIEIDVSNRCVSL